MEAKSQLTEYTNATSQHPGHMAGSLERRAWRSSVDRVIR